MTDGQVKSTQNPYSPSENFFLAWGKDAQNRWVYVGLNYEETQELLQLQGSALEGDELVIVTPGRRTESPEETDRYLDLHDRHEIVRLQLCARDSAARRGLVDQPH